jgi:hypothetical protein
MGLHNRQDAGEIRTPMPWPITVSPQEEAGVVGSHRAVEDGCRRGRSPKCYDITPSHFPESERAPPGRLEDIDVRN